MLVVYNKRQEELFNSSYLMLGYCLWDLSKFPKWYKELRESTLDRIQTWSDKEIKLARQHFSNNEFVIVRLYRQEEIVKVFSPLDIIPDSFTRAGTLSIKKNFIRKFLGVKRLSNKTCNQVIELLTSYINDKTN